MLYAAGRPSPGMWGHSEPWLVLQPRLGCPTIISSHCHGQDPMIGGVLAFSG